MFENVGRNVFRRPEGISSVVQPPKHLHQSRAIVGSTVDYRRAYMDIEGGGALGDYINSELACFKDDEYLVLNTAITT